MARPRSWFEALLVASLVAVFVLEVCLLAFFEPGCFWSVAAVIVALVVADRVFVRIPRRSSNPRLRWLSKSEVVVDGKWVARLRSSPRYDARVEIAYRDGPWHEVRCWMDSRDGVAVIYVKTVMPQPTRPGTDAWTAELLAAVELMLSDLGYAVERRDRPLTDEEIRRIVSGHD